MRMIDKFMRDKNMDESFNGWRRSVGVQEMSSKFIDHVLVGKLRQGAQLFQVIQIQSGIAVRFNKGHVVSGSLDKNRGNLFSKQILCVGFDG